ncbi:hypothetical protein GCM10027275_22010 [Rhabdobacter roseus]|uniref:Uncharacterized protein n=1 Tax=Rhabdobacter roseus TaxID=1655419 RepID=A0A840TIX4_9BACT|nr:hypothetical protein [Rhabdobacter roseus]MBB5284136.1 hypothetical protein [Rhabdobacter roseus]
MKSFFLFIGITLCLQPVWAQKTKQPVHRDVPFVQEHSVKYYADETAGYRLVHTDRNGVVKVLSGAGLRAPHAGAFLYPGTLREDISYRPTADKKVAGLTLYQGQFVYLDDKAVFSNAWAGNLYTKHTLPDARLLAGGKDFNFLIANKSKLQYLENNAVAWEQNLPNEPILDLKADATTGTFWVLTGQSVYSFSGKEKKLQKVHSGTNFTCFEFFGGRLVLGTSGGYLELDAKTGKPQGTLNQKLPWPELTTLAVLDNQLWFGSTRGAFKRRSDGKFDYYASERWLPSDRVVHISGGPDGSVLILTDKGLGKLVFEKMTLHDKAVFFDKQVRSRHIRHGFNGTLGRMKNGDLATGSLRDSDNDGLWTTMYLGGEIFRYAATKDPEALQNCRESLEAMERLYTINGVPGFPSRSFERRGYKDDDKPWRRADDPEWDWKSTTSSDEAIGHVFAFGAMAELIDDKDLKARSVALLDTLMSHIVKNDMYLVDWDGKPTLWGRWHPDYVNGFPTNVGDRKLNSSNIVAMLQTAYHFTKKEKYKQKAFELMKQHGYFENLMRPMKLIGRAPADADEHAKKMSDGWNHSDDEMYYMGYWGLYRYAFNDTLKTQFKKAILDHWEFERPEKDGLWNILTAITGVSNFDLNEAVWYLQEYPLDLIEWGMQNSHRRDIEQLEPNFYKQTTKEILPPDELPVIRHNRTRFTIDQNGRGGTSELSAGDIWLLPYWAGRYLGVISAPVNR